MSGLRDFYNNRILQYNEQTSKLYQIISHNTAKELQDFHNSAAEVAIPEPHLPGQAGHGILIDFCTADDSMMGKVGKDSGVHMISECRKQGNNEGPSQDCGNEIWGRSLELFTIPWSQWQTLNIHQYGQVFADELEARRQKFRLLIKNFCKLACAVTRNGGHITFEWPRHCLGWSDQELQKLIRDLNMMVVDFDRC